MTQAPPRRRRVQAAHCHWCGRDLGTVALGRPRKFCRQSCRQRAYEQRSALTRAKVPEDSVMLSGTEAAGIVDRAFAARCAVEDVATAIAEGADAAELGELCAIAVAAAKDAERLR